LVVVIAASVGKAAFPDINWKPFTFGILCCVDVIAVLIRAEVGRVGMNVVGVVRARRSGPDTSWEGSRGCQITPPDENGRIVLLGFQFVKQCFRQSKLPVDFKLTQYCER
jgi:hypothetical protein